MMRRFGWNAHGILTLLGLFAMLVCDISDAETVSVSTYGGETATGIRKSMIDPAAALVEVNVRWESLQSAARR